MWTFHHHVRYVDRSQEGPSEAASGRVRVPGQGGGGAEDVSHRGEHLRVRRQLQELHGGAAGAQPAAAQRAGAAHGAARYGFRPVVPPPRRREGRRQGAR